MSNFKFKVYELVKSIPKGKVATYGQIASIIQKSKIKNQNFSFKTKVTPRIVGWMLHQNSDSSIPCHRVVDKSGRLATNFGGPSLRSYGRLAPSKFQRSGAFDGPLEQRRRLIAEGVKFIDNMHVDLSKSRWK